MLILAGEDSLSKVRRTHPGKPWPVPKSVRDIQVFMGCAQPPISMLRASSSMGATQNTIKYDEVDGGGKLVEKLLKSRKSCKGH